MCHTGRSRNFFLSVLFLFYNFFLFVTGCVPTFQPDHQGHLQPQLSAGLGDAVGDDGTVDDPAEDVDQDCLDL